MQTQPVFIGVTKSGITIKPECMALLLVLVNHCIKDLRSKLVEYRSLTGEEQEAKIVLGTQRLLGCTEQMAREIEQVKGHFLQVHDRNFQIWSEAFRAVRIRLGLKRIEDSHDLYAFLLIVMRDLKDENRYFSAQKFIFAINN